MRRDKGRLPPSGGDLSPRSVATGPRTGLGAPGIVILTLGLTMAIWPLAMDLYLPAFVQIQEELRTSAAAVQLTLGAAFIGMAVGQLVAGPVSDAVGRRPPLAVGIVVFAAFSVLCAVAPTIEVLIAARALQGAAAAATSVVGMAIARDIAHGTALVRLLARMQLVSGLFTVIGPALGAVILQATDWRSIFVILAGYGAMLFIVSTIALARLPSSHVERTTDPGALGRSFKEYGALLRDRRFSGFAVGGGLQFATMMTYMAASPFLYQEVFGLTPLQYAIVFGGHGALLIAGAQVAARLVRTRSVSSLLIGSSTVFVASAALLLVSVVWFTDLGLVGFVVPVLLLVTAFGAMSPCVQTSALEHHGERAGAAAAVLGSSNMIFGACLSPLPALFSVTSTVPTAVFVLAGAVSCLAFLLYAARRPSPVPVD